jgi:hypothetical protein
MSLWENTGFCPALFKVLSKQLLARLRVAPQRFVHLLGVLLTTTRFASVELLKVAPRTCRAISPVSYSLGVRSVRSKSYHKSTRDERQRSLVTGLVTR